MTALKIDMGFFPVDAFLVRSQAEWEALTKEPWPSRDVIGFCVIVTNLIGVDCIAVYINKAKHKTKAKTVSTIIHESVHAFQMLCELICEESPSDELQAYAIEHIASQIISELT